MKTKNAMMAGLAAAAFGVVALSACSTTAEEPAPAPAAAPTPAPAPQADTQAETSYSRTLQK